MGKTPLATTVVFGLGFMVFGTSGMVINQALGLLAGMTVVIAPLAERVPTSRDSGYSRQLVWLDREELCTIQIRYFDRSDAHLKTMVPEGCKKYLDRFWRSSRIAMTNHLTGKSTDLVWAEYEFGTDLDDFTRTAPKRAR